MKKMSALKLVLVCFLTCGLNCSVSEEIKRKPGDEVILQCRGPKDADINVIKWIRPDLKSEDYVYFIRENRSYKKYQHESFHGRVKLRDPEMKDGDFSVILKNVTINDTGTYECHVAIGKSESSSKLISSITLKVEDSGHRSGHKDEENKESGNKDGHVGLVIGLSVVAVLVVGGTAGFVIYRKQQNTHQPPEVVHQL